ncbi:MAG: hypothetical protein ACRC3B_08040 [Bacteroidia bacterium]
MRVIGRIPHPTIGITIFNMNDKYQLKLEAGPMEQTYKFTHEQAPGVEALEKLADDVFLKTCIDRFNAMYLDMKAALERSALR